ncbi:MAG: glycosyltransferase [Flavobacteriales bacterium]|nr:glycosyltransferase [Flavobacteriales bacterium]
MTRVLYIGDPLSVHDIKWVSFFSQRPDFETYFLVQESELKLLTETQRKQLTDLKITIVGPIKSYSLWRFWENKKSVETIQKVIREQKIDIVHTLFATPFALWTSSLNVPSVTTTRGSDILVVLSSLQNQSGLRGIHSKILLSRFKSAFLKSGAITCTSQGQLDRINEIFNSKISAQIIRTGVNVQEIAELEPDLKLPSIFNGKKIIFLPRYIQPIYRTELQLKAITDLPQELRSRIALILIKGNRVPEEYYSKIEKLLVSCGIPYHVFESLSQHGMWSAFKMSSVAIMSPKTDGTPNSALEAMSAKCSLILGNFQYDEDLFSEEFCLRMRTNLSSELSELITNALSEYPNEMLEKAFENVTKKGNRPTEMNRLLDVYSGLLQR